MKTYQLIILLNKKYVLINVKDFNLQEKEERERSAAQQAEINKERKKEGNHKLRNKNFRLIHNDFFTHVRMKKYKMTENVD
jgi:hypothetical protein